GLPGRLVLSADWPAGHDPCYVSRGRSQGARMGRRDDLERELEEDREYFRRQGTLNEPRTSPPGVNPDAAINAAFAWIGAMLMLGGLLGGGCIALYGALVWLQTANFPTWPLVTWFPIPSTDWAGLN